MPDDEKEHDQPAAPATSRLARPGGLVRDLTELQRSADVTRERQAVQQKERDRRRAAFIRYQAALHEDLKATARFLSEGLLTIKTPEGGGETYFEILLRDIKEAEWVLRSRPLTDQRPLDKEEILGIAALQDLRSAEVWINYLLVGTVDAARWVTACFVRQLRLIAVEDYSDYVTALQESLDHNRVTYFEGTSRAFEAEVEILVRRVRLRLGADGGDGEDPDNMITCNALLPPFLRVHMRRCELSLEPIRDYTHSDLSKRHWAVFMTFTLEPSGPDVIEFVDMNATGTLLLDDPPQEIPLSGFLTAEGQQHHNVKKSGSVMTVSGPADPAFVAFSGRIDLSDLRGVEARAATVEVRCQASSVPAVTLRIRAQYVPAGEAPFGVDWPPRLVWRVTPTSIAVTTTALPSSVSRKEHNVMDDVGRNVFVVHGRDLAARDALFTFLRSVDLNPIEWEEARGRTGKAAPYIGEILDAGFQYAQAIVVLLTGDDEARLREGLRGAAEPPHEVELTPQARANVLFEAGMALARHPERTVLIEVGELRPFSDVAGRHTVRLVKGNAAERHAILGRLRDAGCRVITEGRQDWLEKPYFDLLFPR